MIVNYQVLQGDSLAVLRDMDSDSVNCCVTSPPYWGLRDYGVAGQIGLESTPDAFVSRLVEVFREVRRVLKTDGTCWVNLGDSYASTGGDLNKRKPGFSITGHQSLVAANGAKPGNRTPPAGLKPKDLCGIPWRVAFALQQPYYTGRIKNESDRIWLAAMLDAEGCMFIHKRKAGQNNGQGYQRKNDNYGVGLEISNTHESVIKRCMEIAGIGSVCTQSEGRRQVLYRWNVRTTECLGLIRELYPYLVAKQHQARIAFGCPSSGEKAEAAHAALMALHRGSETTVDFPTPPPCFEQGWYLRQDVIWAKKNPMPESVRDRCTKAHEYVFLLTKAERYWWDMEAMKEASTYAGCVNSFGNKNAAARVVEKLTGNMEAGVSCETKPTRNRRSVWTMATQATPEAHFATFPLELPEMCLRAGCPVDGVVLDPFNGAGTTGLAALKNGRRYIGIELNPSYIEITHERFQKHMPLLAVTV